MKRIHMDRLRKQLTNRANKMPADFHGRFPATPVYDGRLDAVPWAELTVLIRPTLDRGDGRKSSAHRVFVECPCGKLVPAGRIAQHGRACEPLRRFVEAGNAMLNEAGFGSSTPETYAAPAWDRALGINQRPDTWPEGDYDHD